MWSEQLTEAFDYASRLHSGQDRKGNSIPYLAHLLGVASLVLDWGGTEETVIAALLHDAVEDQGGLKTLEEIRGRFGHSVAEIVRGCSDAVATPKPPWRERKAAFLEKLPGAVPAVRLVVGADKLHNLRAILSDYRVVGEHLWDRFSGGREGTLWYYRELIRTFETCGPVEAARELEVVYDQLRELMPPDSGGTPQ